MKKTVHYDSTKWSHIKVGSSALIFPINHPDEDNVSNAKYAQTSEVLSYDTSTGVFETLNTIYQPL